MKDNGIFFLPGYCSAENIKFINQRYFMDKKTVLLFRKLSMSLRLSSIFIGLG